MCSQRTRSADIGILRRRRLDGRGRCNQRVIDVVGVGGLGEIVDGAELHRGDRGGDIAVAGQHHGARLGAHILQRGDHVDAVAVVEPHIHHGESGRAALERR